PAGVAGILGGNELHFGQHFSRTRRQVLGIDNECRYHEKSGSSQVHLFFGFPHTAPCMAIRIRARIACIAYFQALNQLAQASSLMNTRMNFHAPGPRWLLACAALLCFLSACETTDISGYGGSQTEARAAALARGGQHAESASLYISLRSEERRVGKECRSR